MFNNIQCTGYAIGLERLSLLAKIEPEKKQILIISLNQDKKAIQLSSKIRKLKVPCSVMFGKPGKALKYANSYKIPFVVFIGKEEVKKGKMKLRNMKTGKERLVSEKSLGKILV